MVLNSFNTTEQQMSAFMRVNNELNSFSKNDQFRELDLICNNEYNRESVSSKRKQCDLLWHIVKNLWRLYLTAMSTTARKTWLQETASKKGKRNSK